MITEAGATSVLPRQPEPPSQKTVTADIVVGIPTYNHADSIDGLLKAAQAGLAQFPDHKGLIVQADGGSTDGTLERALHAANGNGSLVQITYPLYPVHKLALSYHAVPGIDSAYRTIFSQAQELGAKACCLIEPAAAPVTAGWIRSLVYPVINSGFDLATPQYQRHKYDGLLISGILYPVVRALFGKRVRQPVGSDFGFSAALIRHCLAQKQWNTENSRRQIDLWVNLQAMQGDMRICQVSLGSRSQLKKGAAPDLSTVLADAVGTLFGETEQTAEIWQRVRESQPVPAFGLRMDVDTEPVAVDAKTLIDAFRLGCRNLQDIWSLVLPPATLLELRRMSREPDDAFRFPAELWAQVIYDFAVGYRLRPIGRDHLLQALTPLYMGWAGSFIASVKDARASGVEDQIEQLCRTFESQKRYLISRWRSPDRFMP